MILIGTLKGWLENIGYISKCISHIISNIISIEIIIYINAHSTKSKIV